MMVIIMKGIKICLGGTGIEEIVHIAVKTKHMINRDQTHGNIGIHQITSINRTFLIPMMVTVIEIRINIRLKPSVRINNGKIIGIHYLAMEIQKI